MLGPVSWNLASCRVSVQLDDRESGRGSAQLLGPRLVPVMMERRPGPAVLRQQA